MYPDDGGLDADDPGFTWTRITPGDSLRLIAEVRRLRAELDSAKATVSRLLLLVQSKGGEA